MKKLFILIALSGTITSLYTMNNHATNQFTQETPTELRKMPNHELVYEYYHSIGDVNKLHLIIDKDAKQRALATMALPQATAKCALFEQEMIRRKLLQQ